MIPARTSLVPPSEFVSMHTSSAMFGCVGSLGAVNIGGKGQGSWPNCRSNIGGILIEVRPRRCICGQLNNKMRPLVWGCCVIRTCATRSQYGSLAHALARWIYARVCAPLIRLHRWHANAQLAHARGHVLCPQRFPTHAASMRSHSGGAADCILPSGTMGNLHRPCGVP